MEGCFLFHHKGYGVRHWRPSDRAAAAEVVKQCLEAYGLSFEPEGGDLDVLEVEKHYKKGEFWVVVSEESGEIVGTAGYYELEDKESKESICVEIGKLYLLPEARGIKLGRLLLQKLEEAIVQRGYERIMVQTATVLKEARRLYESSGYQPIGEVGTCRCDRRLFKTVSEG